MTLHNNHHIAGNFWMVQIFTYFEHLQSVQKLELTNFFPGIHVYSLQWLSTDMWSLSTKVAICETLFALLSLQLWLKTPTQWWKTVLTLLAIQGECKWCLLMRHKQPSRSMLCYMATKPLSIISQQNLGNKYKNAQSPYGKRKWSWVEICMGTSEEKSDISMITFASQKGRKTLAAQGKLDKWVSASLLY